MLFKKSASVLLMFDPLGVGLFVDPLGVESFFVDPLGVDPLGVGSVWGIV